MKVFKEVTIPGYPQDGMTLAAHLKKIQELIRHYGGDAVLTFDAGYNNVSAEICYSREETEAERKGREEREEADKAKKRKRLHGHLNRIRKELDSL